MAIDKAKLRDGAEWLTRYMLVANIGANLTLLYLDWELPDTHAIEQAADIARWLFWILAILHGSLERSRPAPAGPADHRPSPVWSGTSVVIITGLAGAFFLWRSDRGDWLMPALAIVATAVIAVWVARFARRHEHAIGEARFDTRNGRDRRR